jgi:hypothetical protein
VPFTEEQFLDLFGAYNAALWPVLLALWLATLGVTVPLVRGRPHTRALAGVTAAQWAWSGVLYHAWFFSRINPAAWLFAVLFVAEAAGFLWLGVVRRRLTFDWRPSPRRLVASIFLAYSFLYPALVLLTGHALPRAPIFGVPCPTTLFTIGLLLVAEPPVSRLLLIVPGIWSIIGGSAALFLGMAPDMMLLPGGVFLAVDMVWPNSRFWRRAARV